MFKLLDSGKSLLKLVTYCLVIFYLSLSISNKSYGKTYNIGSNKISLTTPNDWQEAPNFPHSDLTLFGPFENGRRPIISVEKIPLEQYKIKSEDMKKDQKHFREGRTNWVEKNHGKIIEFKNYEVVSWPKALEVHAIGYTYSMLGNIREEMYYFVTCNGTVFNLMTLATKEQLIKHGSAMERILRSFSCE